MDGDLVVDAGAGRGASSRSAAAVILFAGAVARASRVWIVGPDEARGRSTASRPTSSSTASRSSSTFVLCLGGALAALLAGGYLPEHQLDRGEFYPLLLFSTVGAMMLAAAGDVLDALPRPRDDVARRLRMIGFRRGERALGRGGAEVLPARHLRRGAACSSASRCSTARPATPISPASARRCRHRRAGSTVSAPIVLIALVLILVGLALQGERGAVPHVDAGRLRRRADAGDDASWPSP